MKGASRIGKNVGINAMYARARMGEDYKRYKINLEEFSYFAFYWISPGTF